VAHADTSGLGCRNGRSSRSGTRMSHSRAAVQMDSTQKKPLRDMGITFVSHSRCQGVVSRPCWNASAQTRHALHTNRRDRNEAFTSYACVKQECVRASIEAARQAHRMSEGATCRPLHGNLLCECRHQMCANASTHTLDVYVCVCAQVCRREPTCRHTSGRHTRTRTSVVKRS
jgi:hypothetical protein